MAEFDAFASGVTFGGLRNMLEIKILVCYILDRVKEPMQRKLLCECLQDGGLVNYFDLVSAIDDLIGNGMIYGHDSDGEEYLTVTQSGKTNSQALETTLLPSTREKAVNAALKILARAKAERENKVNIKRTETGFIVEFTIKGFGEELMNLSLYAADILQADKLRDAILSDPVGIYSSVIDSLTK